MAPRQCVRFKFKGPFAVADPAAVAPGGLGVAAAQREWGRRLGVAEIDGAFVKPGHHLPHAGNFALGREAGDLQGMGMQRDRRDQCQSGFFRVMAHVSFTFGRPSVADLHVTK